MDERPKNRAQFPYYIVRFKQHRSECRRHSYAGFPYYIVRFKLFSFPLLFCLYYCFHTTQYDLNLFAFVSERNYCVWFPYYIVRFKLVSNILPYLVVACFHTTQYDLNQIYATGRWLENQFPYYIVRFKLLCIFRLPARPNRSFHTTQYDLNFDHNKFPFHSVSVSILHSTI